MITIGADPEVFVRKGNHWISSHVFECGTKHSPMHTDHGSVQMDGFALECNVVPAATPTRFVKNVKNVLDDLRHIVTRVVPDAEIVAAPSVFVGIKRLSSLPEWVSELGCTPDFNAYTGRINPRPDANVPFRTGAGHVHIGFTENANPRDRAHFNKCCRIARECDFYLGLPSLLYDTDTRRRSLYGQAGAFRPKPYGLEYRVLSNAWLSDERLMIQVFNRAFNAFHQSLNDDGPSQYFPEGLAAELINSNALDWPDRHPELAEYFL